MSIGSRAFFPLTGTGSPEPLVPMPLGSKKMELELVTSVVYVH